MPTPRRVAVFAAMQWECRPVLQSLRDVRRTAVDGLAVWRGSSALGPVTVIRTGIGLDLASSAAAKLGPQARFDMVVSTGCAGGLAAGCSVGELAVATVCHDATSNTSVAVDGTLGDDAARVATALGAPIHRGPMLSVREPLATVTAKREASARGFLAVEMESAAIGSWAAGTRTPYIAVRSILDDADTELVDTGGLDPMTGRVRPLPFLRYAATNPGAVPQLWSMGRNAARAEAALLQFFRAWMSGVSAERSRDT